MHGYELDKPGHDPFEVAKSKAIQGVEAGLVVYNLTHEALRATFIFTPEVSLNQAMIMLPICGIGFQNARGSGSPEVAVHLLWSGGVLINGARCGKLRVSANHQDPTKVPDWLCVGLELDLWPASENMGETPNETALTLRDAQRLTLRPSRSLGAPYFKLVDQMGSRWGKNGSQRVARPCTWDWRKTNLHERLKRSLYGSG